MLRWIAAAALALGAPVRADATELPPPAEVMAIPQELRQLLDDKVLAGDPAPLPRFNRLLHLTLDRSDSGLGLVYADDADGTVAQTFASRKANCLSFTLLFIALARAAGLDATPQEIRETLAWRQDNGILYRTDHINTLVRVAGRQYVVDIAGGSVIALDAPIPVSDPRLLAHHYNNIAMQQLEHDRLALAQAAMRRALELDAGYAAYWSNAGVLALRAGDDAAAERDYARALAVDADNASALFNMLGLLQRRGDHARAVAFRQRLDRVQQRDPFHHFLLATDAERAGDLAGAIGHYRAAIRLHHREHRFHAALARAYRQSGDTRAALKALERARKLSDGAARADYEALLEAWRRPPS